MFRDINLKFKLELCSQDEVLGATSSEADAHKELNALALELDGGLSAHNLHEDVADPLDQKIKSDAFLAAAEELSISDALGGHQKSVERVFEILRIFHEIAHKASEHVHEHRLGLRLEAELARALVVSLAEVRLHVPHVSTAAVAEVEVRADNERPREEL